MKFLEWAVGGAVGVVVGLLIAGVLIAVQGGVCSVPLLNLSHCYGLGAPTTMEQVIMLLVGAGIGGAWERRRPLRSLLDAALVTCQVEGALTVRAYRQPRPRYGP